MSVPAPCDLLIHNGFVISMDPQRRVYPAGAVAIGAGRIAAVGPEREVAPRFAPARRIDARGAPVHPGFVEGHYHTSLHLTRGAISDDPRPPADNPVFGPAAYIKWFNALTDEDEHASALMACVELLENGYTAFLEAGTVFEPDAAARAAGESGIRASISDPFVWDHPEGDALAGSLERAPADPKRARDLLGRELRRNHDPDARVRAHVCLYGSASASEELMCAAKALADEAGVVLAQHQNFEPDDTDRDRERFGRSPLVHLAEIGVLGSNCTLTHMNMLDDAEVDAVVDASPAVVWHPGNYLFYGLGGHARSRMAELHQGGVALTFGTDVAKVWPFGDLGWLGYLVARSQGRFLPAESILEMLTLGGARAMGLHDRVGSLEPGKRADLVIRRDDLADAQPGVDPIRQMVLVSRTKSVATVIVDGEVVVENGRTTRVDRATVYAQARRSAARMIERVGLAVGTTWPTVQ